MFNILVTGAKGQLGSELKKLEALNQQYNFYFTDIETLDITKYSEVYDFIVQKSINAIINCAAHTAVDKAENEFELSNALNHLAVANFSKIAKEKAIKLIQISTDYVYDGKNYIPYIESDKTNPQGVYGLTKLAGEKAMLKVNPPNSIIIRTSWVYSQHGSNFVKTMLHLGEIKDELGIIYDQIGTPTNAGDLAKAILTILPQIKSKNVEIYHYSNEGVCSWYDFAKAIFELKNKKILINPITTSEYKTPAKRPHYSVLDKAKIKKKFSVEIPYWKESLTNFLKNE